ncbi:MAG: Mrp/NBP35 family ATP-binding protein [Clostridia bacterium]|nr:Mrp/NBP35 family ATP-binding protein [Clostridia bacterium]
MADCNHDCSSCGKTCAERAPQDLHEKPHAQSHIKKVIAVVSGKGGVGKSLVTSLLAVNSSRNGFRTAILDADITGPSIPNVFGVHEKALGNGEGILPVRSKTGIDLMSINLLLENETDPVVWRGPIIAGAVKQFWTEVIWSDVDFMYVDMPPGTGDVPLTVFQSLPIDGIVIVTSPQELVGMIVQKAVKMAEMLHLPILGVVENYSYFECPDCGKRHKLFGDSHLDQIVSQYGIDTVCRIPIQPKLAEACDAGLIEFYEGDWLATLSEKITKL